MCDKYFVSFMKTKMENDDEKRFSISAKVPNLDFFNIKAIKFKS
jgi:hypothetical protein